MTIKKEPLEEKACLNYNYQGDTHDPLNVTNISLENRDEGHAEFKHTYD